MALKGKSNSRADQQSKAGEAMREVVELDMAKKDLAAPDRWGPMLTRRAGTGMGMAGKAGSGRQSPGMVKTDVEKLARQAGQSEAKLRSVRNGTAWQVRQGLQRHGLGRQGRLGEARHGSRGGDSMVQQGRPGRDRYTCARYRSDWSGRHGRRGKDRLSKVRIGRRSNALTSWERSGQARQVWQGYAWNRKAMHGEPRHGRCGVDWHGPTSRDTAGTETQGKKRRGRAEWRRQSAAGSVWLAAVRTVAVGSGAFRHGRRGRVRMNLARYDGPRSGKESCTPLSALEA